MSKQPPSSPGRPASLRILGKRYSIEMVPDSALDPRLQGHIVHRTGRITMQSGMSPDEERETLLHECLHSIVDHLQLGLEENQVGALSVGLWQLAQAEPAAVRWMLGLES